MPKPEWWLPTNSIDANIIKAYSVDGWCDYTEADMYVAFVITKQALKKAAQHGVKR